jgi:CubicO group peptidase (beta-lactamase class C family)
MVVLAISLPVVAGAQKPTGRSPLTGIEAWIDTAMVKGHGVGLAVAVVKDDSIVFAKGFGVKKLGDPAPVDPKTIFAVGSTSKAFTAAALGMLVDEGRIGWDDKVTDRLPGFQLYDPAVTREITIRDLLTHRSGLSRGDRIWLGSNLSRAEVIRRVRFHRPTWSFRTVWGYQNMMYLTAGEVIPAVTGTTWDAFLKDRIFTPLGMSSTSTSTRGLETQADVAQPHEDVDGKITTIPWRNIDNVGPAGSINSNVLDMAQWIRFHLAGGSVGGKQLLRPETHRELLTPQMWIRSAEGLETFYGSTHFLGYGLGWFLFDRAGRKIIEHSGGIDGMITELILVPEEKLGVIVLSNRSSLLAFPVGQHIVDQYLGQGNVDRLGSFLASQTQSEARERTVEDSLTRSRAASSRPALAIEAYTGTFDNPMFGPARVALESGKLVVQIQSQRNPLNLEHWQYDTFRGAWGDRHFGKAFVTFRVVNGTATGLTIDGIEQEFVRRAASVAALACEPSDIDQTRLETRRSPYDSAAVRLGSREARVCYSRPSARGRVVFGGEVVPYDTLWRTGANDPTIIHLPFAAEIGGLAVPAGKYSIYTVPGRAGWKVVINRETVRGGLTRDEGQFKNQYTDEVRAQEVGRGTAASEALTEPVEKFTIRSEMKGPDQADLILEWEKTRVRIPIRASARE